MQRSFMLILAACAVVGVVLLSVWLMLRSLPAEKGPSESAEQVEGRERPEPSATSPISSTRFDPAADPEEVAPESKPATKPDGVVVFGKVVDDRRRPSANAVIDLAIPGRELLHAKSEKDGGFQIGIGPKDPDTIIGMLHANGAGGGVAVKDIFFDQRRSGDVVDLGTLPLLSGSPVNIRVLKDGAPAEGARVFIGRRTSLGLGPLMTNADGTTGPRRVPDGTYLVSVFLGDEFRGEAELTVPRSDNAPLDVAVVPAWRLLVTVKDGGTGKPIVGARLWVTWTLPSADNRGMNVAAMTSKPIPATDAEGQSVLSGLLPDYPVTVSVTMPNAWQDRFSYFGEGLRETAKPGNSELLITFPAGETFTFPIVPDETDGPPDGAIVKLSLPQSYGGAVPPPTGKVVGRNLVVDGITERHTNILATAPDGTIAIVRILGEARTTKVGSEAKFKKLRSLRVTARERGGPPLTGYIVNVVTPGNADIGTRCVVDGDGNGRIDGIYPQRVDVQIRRPKSDQFSGKVAGSVDLTAPGEGSLDITLEPEREFVVHCTVDAEARLPASYTARLSAGDRPAMRPPADMSPIEEDPEKATLVFKVRLDPGTENLRLNISAKSCIPVALELSRGEGRADLTAAFVSGASIKLHVVPPSDNVHDVSIQRWSDTAPNWGAASMNPRDRGEMGKRPTEATFDALRSGRYRARDSMTGLVSKPVEVEVGRTVDLTLDLSRAGPVTGRVEGPSGDESPEAIVVAEGTDISKSGAEFMFDSGTRVRVNGEFKARVPGDRPVTFRVKHPFLVPSPDAGSATVTAPGSSVLLKLVGGPTAVFKYPTVGLTARERGESQFSRERILLFTGKPEGEPVQTCQVKLKDGAGLIGGYKPGRYTLWCDFPTSAPLILENVELGPDKTDLGELEFSEGATIRVTFLVKNAQQVSRFDINATSVDGPKYSRHVMLGRGGTEGSLKGIGPGRFKVDVAFGGPFGSSKTFEVPSTGSGEIPLTVDLR